jgi:hypothetical protein
MVRRGFATVAAVALLMLALTLVSAAVFLAQQTQTDHRRAEAAITMRAAAWTRLGALLTAVQTWNADELSFDAWWAQNGAAFGTATALGSLSSRLSLNSVTPFLLQDSDLKATLLTSSDDFVTYRSSHGPRAQIADYAKYFTPQSLSAWYCVESHFSVNTADEIMLEKVVSLRTGSEAVGSAVRQGLRNFRQNKQPLSATDWQTLAGADFERLDGLLTIEPELDVNEAPAELLQVLFKDPDFALQEPDVKLQKVLTGRLSQPWTPEPLRLALGVDKNSPLLQYLGTRTSVLEARITQDTLTMRFVIALSYSQDSPPKISPRVLESQDLKTQDSQGQDPK